jgi:DeoR family transcriptional regulator, myo-inositol catabolism operon repressor
MRSKRIEEIKDYIYKNKTVSLDQICHQFNISKSTLRRDLESILTQGDIKKIYGGVTVLPKKELIPFETRNIANPEKKMKIASAAAQLIKNGDIIFIDSGTTTMHILESIKNKKDITILTNNVEIILQAIGYDNINIITLSGSLNRKTLSFTGNYAAQVLQHYNISKAFMATAGFSIANGVTNSSPAETALKHTAVERSQSVYLLADSSKCGEVSLMTYCGLEQIDILITESAPTPDICEFMKKNGHKILIAK